MEKHIQLGNVRQSIIAFLTWGIILGFIFGVAKALIFIHANRYLELGMYNIALSYFQTLVNHFFIFFLSVSSIIFLTTLFLYFVLTILLRDRTKGKTYTLYTVGTMFIIGVSLLIVYQLNKSSWFPPFYSIKGLLYNSVLTLLLTFIGVIVFKKFSEIYGFTYSVTTTPYFRITALIVISLILILNGAFYYHESQKDRNGLNILFITADTLRADHLRCYGYVRETSPNIDKLAREGVLFSQAIVQWPKTAPSFASMLTSTYGYYNGVKRKNPHIINPYFVLLPEILKNADYNTVGVVTNGGLSPRFNFDQGIDTHVVMWQRAKSTDAEYVTEYALSWLEDNSLKGKFFMWLHYLDPHARYEPPGVYNEMFVGDEHYDGSQRARLNLGFMEDIGGISSGAQLGNHNEIDHYVAQYDAEIRYMDENIGKVLNALETMGLSDNTVIVFTSDHGESLGDHNYYFEHGRLPYDDCLRVPLIIKVPGLKPEIKVINQQVELINLMPTILDILNIPINNEAQGKSLVPLMLGDSNSISQYAFTEAGYRPDYQRAIRTKKWKLIYIPDKEDQKIMQGMPFELYDIENDPYELNNLITVETKIAGDLKRELFRWMESGKGAEVKPPRAVSIDKETEENLRSLGYIR